jgi:multiple sugar transport system permease protein
MASAGALTQVKPNKGKLSRTARIEQRWGYIYISPWIVGFIIFTLGPMIASLYYSFTNYEIPFTPKWIGLANYVRALTKDELVPRAMLNTLYYVGFAVPLGLIASLSLALLLDRDIWGRAIWRTIYYLPSIVPTVASTLLFLYLFQPDYGLINSWIYDLFGVRGPGWFNDPDWVKPTFIIMALWGAGGSTMIIFLAGLQNVPQELYEAAEVDGAGRWHKFLNITIPMLSPTIFFNLITGVIGAFRIFTAAYVATGGGPAYGSYFYVLHLFLNAFSYWKSGYASALAWMLFLMILVLTLVQFRLSNRWVYYESSAMSAG